MMKIKEILKQANRQLQKYSPTAPLDAEILLSSVLKKNREFLFSNPDYQPSSQKIKTFKALIQKRIEQEPIAYLIKEKDFYGRTFDVDCSTLIPRPETELLVEKTLEYCHKEFYPSQNIALIDIGTGSGCILVSLLKELQKKRFRESKIKAFGIDISAKALRIAKKNSERIELLTKINFLKGSLLEPIFGKNFSVSNFSNCFPANTQLVITANLPYLSADIYENCPKSVLDFEPKKALIAKKDGLEFYLKLLNQIKRLKLPDLVQNLYLIFEISPEQKNLAEEDFKKIFPNLKVKFSKDLAQKWRFIEIFF